MAKANKKKVGFVRLLFICGLVLAVLLGAALLIVPRFIPWDKVKKQAEEKISDVLHHQVTISEIGFNLFKGIEVRQLRIENAKGFSPEPLLTDEIAAVQYRLLPLLFGQVAIKAVILKEPRVIIEKKADGTFNFSDMLPAKKAAGKKPDGQEQKKGLPSIPVELLVSRFAVTDALLVYRDLGKKQEYRIEALNLNMENLTLAGITPAKVTLGTKVKALGQTYPLRLETKWRFNYKQEKFTLDSMHVNLPGINMEATGLIEQVIASPALALSGKLKLDLAEMITKLLPPEVRKKIPQDLHVQGSALVGFQVKGPAKQIAKLEVNAEDTVEVNVSTKGIKAPIKIQGKVGLAAGNATINQTLALPGMTSALEAKLEDVLKTRKLAAELSGKIELEKSISELMPMEFVKKLAHLQTSGTISYTVRTAGAVTKPKALSLESQLQVKDVRVSFKEKVLMENFGMDVSLKPQSLRVKKIKADLAGNPLSGELSVQGFDVRDPETLKPEKLKAKMDWEMTAKLLDVDAVLALLPQKPKKSEDQAKSPEKPETVSDLPEPDVRKFIPKGVVINGKASLGGIKFGTVKLGRLEFSMQQAKSAIKILASVRGYQGKIQNTTRLDFSKALLAYGVEADAAGVDLEPLMNDIIDTFVAAKLKKPKIISELKDKLTGRFTGKIKISGTGMRTKTAMPNLKGNGDCTLKAGRLRQFGFQDNLAQWFGSDKFSQDIPFDNTNIEFSIGRQKVKVSKFVMESGVQGKSGDIRMTGNGQITFKADFDNFNLRPRLNPRAASNLSPEFKQYTEILKDDRGWVTIPAVLNGPIKKPGVTPDWNWMKDQIGKYAKRKVDAAGKAAQDKAKKFVEQQKGKSSQEVQKNVSQEVEKAKEKLKKLDLKNLFK